MEQEKDYSNCPFLGLPIEEKPGTDKIVTGKPYPEDFGTTVEEVRVFINNYWDKRDTKPVLVFHILITLVGAILLGGLFYFFYENTIITIMFAALGGWLGYAAYKSLFNKGLSSSLHKMLLNSPEGIYLAALELWQKREDKKNLEQFRAEEKAYQDNPWIVTESGLFPEDPLCAEPIKARIEPVLDDNNRIVDYQFHAWPAGAEWIHPIWYPEKNIHPHSPSYVSQILEIQGCMVDMRNAEFIVAHRKNDGKEVTFFKWNTELLHR